MSDVQEVRKGRCACGAVRFEVHGEPLITHCCHCLHCQRESGSAFALNMLVGAEQVRFEGKTEAVATPSASGKGQLVLRCTTCQVALSSQYAGAGPHIHFIRVGTIEEGARPAPDVHIYTSTKVEWVVLPEGAQVFEEYYKVRETWSAESLARLEEIKAR